VHGHIRTAGGSAVIPAVPGGPALPLANDILQQTRSDLVDSKWQGNICIEHEPHCRDPMPEIKRSLNRLKEWLG